MSVALVTGASRGIGAGIARALAREGHTVAVGYHRREDDAVRIARELDGLAVRLELGEPEDVARAVEHVSAELGPPLILVNNAAIAQEKPFEELSEEDWERMLSVNLLGAVRTTRACLGPMLDASFGRIVNVSSIGGQWGGKNQVHYAASKAALINFTQSLARLYSARGVTANALAPGLIATEMSAAELGTDAGREKVRGIPAGRLGTVEEAGAAVAFLCSEGAAYVTGQTINLNGGMLFG